MILQVVEQRSISYELMSDVSISEAGFKCSIWIYNLSRELTLRCNGLQLLVMENTFIQERYQLIKFQGLLRTVFAQVCSIFLRKEP